MSTSPIISSDEWNRVFPREEYACGASIAKSHILKYFIALNQSDGKILDYMKKQQGTKQDLYRQMLENPLKLFVGASGAGFGLLSGEQIEPGRPLAKYTGEYALRKSPSTDESWGQLLDPVNYPVPPYLFDHYDAEKIGGL